MKQKGLTGELIGEIFGTFVLILLGDGVVANVGLAPVLLVSLQLEYHNHRLGFRCYRRRIHFRRR